jgi:hypothetical protein
MEKPLQVSEENISSSSTDEAEGSMETQILHESAETSEEVTANSFCAHGRLIDDVRTRGGRRTGKVRCLECRAIFDDPYQGLK